MALTAQDIHSKEFSKSFRGYDIEEVDRFLDEVIRDYDALTRERNELALACEELQQHLDRFQSIEDSLNKSIMLAQETAEEVKRNAMQEGRMTLKEAEKNADRIINDALMKASKISLEMEDMKHQAKIFKSRMKMLLETQLDMLSNENWTELMALETKPKELEVGPEPAKEYSSPANFTGYDQTAEEEMFRPEVSTAETYEEEEPASTRGFSYMPEEEESTFVPQTEPSFQEEESEQRSSEGKFVSYFNRDKQIEDTKQEEEPIKTFRFRYNKEE